MLKIIILLFLFAFSSCREVIVHEIEELEANQVCIYLHKSGIEAEKVQSSVNWNIEVSRDDYPLALEILDHSRILHKLTKRVLPENNSIMQSSEEKLEFLNEEKAKRLEQTLENYHGVLQANVHLNLSRNNQFEINQVNSASVLLAVEKEIPLNLDYIKVLVEGALGIDKNKIFIVQNEFSSAAKKQTFTKSILQRTVEQRLAYLIALMLIVLVILICWRKQKINYLDNSVVTQNEQTKVSPVSVEEESF
ncbi:MAG: hypothetical protein KBC84_03480 [Proteobacteria bacterium]|nr:hypothetical protein [Pseudomonadota bacterium]